MRAYLDNAATTPMAPEVIEVMTNVMKDNFGNPSSQHSFGRESKAIIEHARRKVARLINAESKEIIFTSGGTEADNLAIHAAIDDLGVTRIITSAIEHHAVGHTVTAQSKAKVHYVNLTPTGRVDIDHLEELLKSSNEKTLVSLMHANNEIGTLLDVRKVGNLCKTYGAYFHSDTVQTMGHYAVNIHDPEIHFVTCAAHKFHGPKGIGFLYVNKNLKFTPAIHGGSQERGLRGGTENLAGIAGLAKALELANENIEEHQQYVQGLKSYMIDQLQKRIPGVGFHGEIDPRKSLYTVLNVKFPDFEHKAMFLFLLDLEGVACSGGSACTSGASTGSHVLEGIKAETRKPNARFSFSRYTTKAEIDFALEKIEKVLHIKSLS